MMSETQFRHGEEGLELEMVELGVRVGLGGGARLGGAQFGGGGGVGFGGAGGGRGLGDGVGYRWGCKR